MDDPTCMASLDTDPFFREYMVKINDGIGKRRMKLTEMIDRELEGRT